MSGSGYDPDRLAVLYRRIDTTSQLLASWRCHDPLAAEAIAAIRAARATLDGEVAPRVRQVLLDDPLGRRPVPGPTTWFEPLAAHLTPWLDGVADRIAAGAASAMAWLAGAAPAPDTAEATLVGSIDALASRRIELADRLVWDPDDRAARDEILAIDAEVAALLAAYAADAPTDGHVPWFPTALLQVSPYAAAMSLGQLDLDDATLAAVASLVVRRWHDGQEHGARWDDTAFSGPNTGDLVFDVLAARPVAATAFLLRATPDEVLRSAQDATSVTALLVAGTSPDHVDESTAGTVLRPLLQYLPAHELPTTVDGVAPGLTAAIATAVGPWLPALGPRAAHWGWQYDDGDDALRWLVADDDALVALTASLQQWHGRLATAPLVSPDGRLDGDLLYELSTMVSQVQVAIRDQALDEVHADALANALVFEVAGIVVEALVPGGLAVEAGSTVISPLALSALDRLGLVPSASRRADQVRAGWADATAQTAIVAVTGTVAAAIERGDLPSDALDRLSFDDLPDGCAPDVVLRRLDDYLDEVAALTDPATGNALRAVLYAFVDPGVVNAACR
ncbi:MAG: hypothetical protein KDB40_05915 [Acidimicrobiales bacterium]|nr:hypothetical protein [Acidimicrobiales bacterium]